MAKRKSPRKRINRFVFILTKIYEFDYKVTKKIYDKFEQDLEATKVALNLEKMRIAATTGYSIHGASSRIRSSAPLLAYKRYKD